MERNELMQEEEEIERQGFLDRFKNMFSHGDEYEDENELEPTAPAARASAGPRPLLRMESGRANSIYVRKDFRAMEDATATADRLKERRPVIVNFAHADPEVARRGVDFISGVVYALDGYYQKVGENVFLFTPSSMAIALEDTDEADRTSDLYGEIR